MNNFKSSKPVSKTETTAEFLARGGQIKRFETREPKRGRPHVMKMDAIEEDVDFSALPVALKIRYGIKG